ncbi:MAG TPA: hypothetical protein VMU04_23285 [Candidatus Acidoferrum sp.]|nr:hypothetical protein [Candidatus Acidoferrum sp.]
MPATGSDPLAQQSHDLAGRPVGMKVSRDPKHPTVNAITGSGRSV